MKEIQLLFKLQELDKRRDELEKELESLPLAKQIETLSQEIACGEQSLSDAKGRLLCLKKEQKEKEWELRDASSTQAQLEKKLFGGEVQNPREIEGMRHKLDKIVTGKGMLEDKIIGLMGDIEDLELTIKKREEELAGKKKAIEELRIAFQERVNILSADIDAILRERSTLAGQVESGLLEKYEHLFKAKGGMAIAFVNEGTCGGCHVTLPTFLVSRLKVRDSLVRCENCGRILYLS